jgi:NADH dehydrogenase
LLSTVIGNSSEYEVIALKRDDGDGYVTSLIESAHSLAGNEMVLIHCGWDTRDRSVDAQQKSFISTTELAKCCVNLKIGMVFISSQSALSESNYGRMKYLAEQSVIEKGGTVVRPGLIMFDDAQGLQKLIGRKIMGLVEIKTNPPLMVRVINAESFARELTGLLSLMPERNEIIDLFDVVRSVDSAAPNSIDKARLTVTVPLWLLKKVLKFTSRLNSNLYAKYDSFLGLTTSRN